MTFTNEEKRFLCLQHFGMAPIDRVSMQIPLRILQGILERRAYTLGAAFIEFRNEHGESEPAPPAPKPADPGLSAAIENEKPF
jgi:hypothetical protein